MANNINNQTIVTDGYNIGYLVANLTSGQLAHYNNNERLLQGADFLHPNQILAASFDGKSESILPIKCSVHLDYLSIHIEGTNLQGLARYKTQKDEEICNISFKPKLGYDFKDLIAKDNTGLFIRPTKKSIEAKLTEAEQNAEKFSFFKDQVKIAQIWANIASYNIPESRILRINKKYEAAHVNNYQTNLTEKLDAMVNCFGDFETLLFEEEFFTYIDEFKKMLPKITIPEDEEVKIKIHLIGNNYEGLCKEIYECARIEMQQTIDQLQENVHRALQGFGTSRSLNSEIKRICPTLLNKSK